MSDVVNKLWGFCHTLRHDGVDCGDYLEQLTYLLFLKMADERGVTGLAHVETKDERGEAVVLDCSWPPSRASALLDHFADSLRILGRQPGLLGSIFAQAQSRSNNPVNLKRVLAMTDAEA